MGGGEGGHCVPLICPFYLQCGDNPELSKLCQISLISQASKDAILILQPVLNPQNQWNIISHIVLLCCLIIK